MKKLLIIFLALCIGIVSYSAANSPIAIDKPTSDEHFVCPMKIWFRYSSPENVIQVFTDSARILLKEVAIFESLMDAVRYWWTNEKYYIRIFPESMTDTMIEYNSVLDIMHIKESVPSVIFEPSKKRIRSRAITDDSVGFRPPYTDELVYDNSMSRHGEVYLTEAEIFTNAIQITTFRIGDTPESIIDKLNVGVDVSTTDLSSIYFESTDMRYPYLSVSLEFDADTLKSIDVGFIEFMRIQDLPEIF